MGRSREEQNALMSKRGTRHKAVVDNLVKVVNRRTGLPVPPFPLVFVEGATGIRQKTYQSATGHSNTGL